ncbi:MAG: c-type cytochrome domain-containing protein [Anaerolineales bacterium]
MPIIQRKRRFSVFLAIGFVLLLAACGPAATPEPTATPSPVPSDTPTPEPTMTPTPEPTATDTPEPPATEVVGPPATSWETGIDLILSDKCGRCHNSASLKGNFDITSYETAIEGGSSGPGIVPGKPSSSGIVRKMRAGGHPEQLTEEELQAVADWIQAGAPQEPGYTSWADGIGYLMNEKCGECHGPPEPAGQLDLTTYNGLLVGGDTGPAVVLGEPMESLLIQIQATGGHPGQFEEAELEAVRQWIEASAPAD